MDALDSAGSAMAVPAAGNLRPRCMNMGACIARTPGKHCPRCTSASPETRARKSAGLRSAMASKPELKARRIAQLRSFATDPEIAARKSATLRALHTRPEVKERHRAAVIAGSRRRLSTPEGIERAREIGRRSAKLANSAAGRARAAATRRAAYLAWCPEEYHAFDRSLKRKGYLMVDRKRLVAEAIAVDARKAVQAAAATMLEKYQRDLASRY